MVRAIIAAFSTGLVLAACAPTVNPVVVTQAEVEAETRSLRQLYLEELVSEKQRLETVSFRIMHGAANSCAERTRAFHGLIVATEHSFGSEMRDAARSALGLDERLRVLYVIPGSPADLTGLKSGDVIAEINGKDIRSGMQAERLFATIRDGTQAKPMIVTLQDQPVRTVIVTPVDVCDYPVKISPKDTVNALAYGHSIVVTRGMMRFSDDTELAFVLSHELAHNLLNHVGSLLAATARDADLEAQADYVGLYTMARAGYRIDGALNFWRRMAVTFPNMISNANNHPGMAYRLAALKKTRAEINAKIASGEPLLWNAKRKRNAPDQVAANYASR